MMVYVEKPNVHESTMTALAAKDAIYTSTANPQYLPLTPNNILIHQFSGKTHSSTVFHNAPSTGIPSSIPFFVEHPMVIDDVTYHYQDSHQPVDLTALQLNIQHTGNIFCTLLTTLPHPSMQPIQQLPSTIEHQIQWMTTMAVSEYMPIYHL